MKKAILLMAAALCFTMQATAQTQFATLVHNDTLSSFTGVDALSEAMAAAADGDVITLSSGTFNGCTISKAITLRGAGMEADEQGRKTIISSNLTNSSSTSKTAISLEGICMSNSSLVITDGEVGSVYLNKCIIKELTIGRQYGTCKVDLSHITNCKISNMNGYYSRNEGKGELYCYNSSIGSPGSSGFKALHFYNCIMGVSAKNTPISFDGLYYNCILLLEVTTKPSTTDHCVIPVALEGGRHTNNYVVEDVTTLFNNYDAEATWYTRDLTLTDEAKATYLGSDGTEVGIYGGSLPFSPWLDRPVIKRLTVAPKSSKNGKLSVDIEVSETE